MLFNVAAPSDFALLSGSYPSETNFYNSKQEFLLRSRLNLHFIISIRWTAINYRKDTRCNRAVPDKCGYSIVFLAHMHNNNEIPVL